MQLRSPFNAKNSLTIPALRRLIPFAQTFQEIMESEKNILTEVPPAPAPDAATQADLLPPPPPPENEPNGPAETPPETPTQQKIDTATRGIFEKAGFFFRRGPGRARKDGTPKVSDTPLAASGVDRPPLFAPDPAMADRSRMQSLAKRCCKAAIKALWSVLDKIVFSRAILATNGDREAAQRFVEATKATELETDSSAECLEILSEMYGWDPKIMALVAGLATFGGTTGRYALAIGELNSAIAKQRNPQRK